MPTGTIKISRDATFVKDTFEVEPRNYTDETSAIEFEDQDESDKKEKGKTGVDVDSSSDGDEDTKPSNNNTKRHTCTQSLEKVTVIPSPKQRTYRGLTFEHVSVAVMDSEAAYIVDSARECRLHSSRRWNQATLESEKKRATPASKMKCTTRSSTRFSERTHKWSCLF